MFHKFAPMQKMLYITTLMLSVLEEVTIVISDVISNVEITESQMLCEHNNKY
jgi:hypothetical protein